MMTGTKEDRSGNIDEDVDVRGNGRRKSKF